MKRAPSQPTHLTRSDPLTSTVVAGYVVDRTHHYKRVMIVALILALGALIWLIFALKPDNTVSISLAMAAVGLSALSLTPVCLELSVEVWHSGSRPWRRAGLY